MKHFDTVITFQGSLHEKGRPIEYKMSPSCMKALLQLRRGEESKWPVQRFLCNYVNTNYNLKGTCSHVVIG